MVGSLIFVDYFLDIPATTDQGSLTVVIDTQLKVEVTAGFDLQLLRQVIAALRGL